MNLKYKIGEIVVGSVIKIKPNYMLIKLEDGNTGFLHISELSDFFINKIEGFLDANKKYEFIVKEFNEKINGVKLSWKDISPRFLTDPFEFEIEETKQGFKTLEKNKEKWND